MIRDQNEVAMETQNALNNLNLRNQMSLAYEWDKGQATTQAWLITSLLNHKGYATKFKKGNNQKHLV